MSVEKKENWRSSFEALSSAKLHLRCEGEMHFAIFSDAAKCLFIFFFMELCGKGEGKTISVGDREKKESSTIFVEMSHTRKEA